MTNISTKQLRAYPGTKVMHASRLWEHAIDFRERINSQHMQKKGGTRKNVWLLEHTPNSHRTSDLGEKNAKKKNRQNDKRARRPLKGNHPCRRAGTLRKMTTTNNAGHQQKEKQQHLYIRA